MMDRIDACVITELELLCLASLYGMKKIYGYNTGRDGLKKNIHYALYALAKKGYIYIDENNDVINISKDIEDILALIKNTEDILDIKVCNTGERVIIYRRNKDKAVIIRQNCVGDNELIISVIPTKYVLHYLVDEGYIRFILKNETFTREDVYDNEVCRKDIKEDRILVIKRINKEYNIDLEEKIEIYESVIYDMFNNRNILLTCNNFCSVIDRGFIL